jgi:hypothetical protein
MRPRISLRHDCGVALGRPGRSHHMSPAGKSRAVATTALLFTHLQIAAIARPRPPSVPHHLPVLADKSVLQGLANREAEWLFHHFNVNLPPVFFAELIADLRKEKGFSTRAATPEADVMMLAAKVDSGSIYLNAASSDLLNGELHGARFEMDGRPVLTHAERVQMPDGGVAMYLDQTPIQRVMDRWQAGDFEGMEHAFAKVWREGIKAIDLQTVVRSMKGLRNRSLTTLDEIAEAVNATLAHPEQRYANLQRSMVVLGVPEKLQRRVIERWKSMGRPPLVQFAPYTVYTARVELFFLLGVGHQVITTRSTNWIDVEYLKYLPFTRVFCSSDKLHADLFPHFATNQMFISGPELKASLRDMADYYDALSDDQRSHGSFTYADYPPVHMDNAITRSYDCFIPNWRDGANQPRPPRDPETDAKIMQRLRPMMEAIEAHRKRTGAI